MKKLDCQLCGTTFLVKGNRSRKYCSRQCNWKSKVTHGHSTEANGRRSLEYISWCAMKGRCNNQRNRSYKDYGGRGISVCTRWLEAFENFLADMGPRPKGTSIERIDVNGNYEPGNCKWATTKEQSRNKRTTTWVQVGDSKITLADLADTIGVNIEIARKRLTRKATIDKLALPPRVKRAGQRVQQKSQYTGVYWNYKCQKWRAVIWIKGKACHVGLFSTPEEALKARETALEESRLTANVSSAAPIAPA